jgi:hypothetical protein
MTQLAKLTQITDLHEIWKHEGRDFSAWLSEEENLNVLSDAIGIDIILDERESAIGDPNVGLFAYEEGSNRKIVIESQLEDTDHDHLGKTIAFAAAKSANVVIWIAKRARDDHRRAFEWLNRRSDGNLGFFLVEMELWKIGNSLPAPRFNVVEKPNDWAKAMKTMENLSEKRKVQLDFWQSFCDYANAKPEFVTNFSRRKPNASHYYVLSLGSAKYHLTLTVYMRQARIGVEITIPDNKGVFAKLHSQMDEIAYYLGLKLDWREIGKACLIKAYRDADIKNDRSTWNGLFDFYCGTAIKFKEMIQKFDV